MKMNRKAFKRGILSLVALEALSLMIVLTMNHEVPRNDVFPRLSDLLDNVRMPLLLLFVIPLNFPGLALASKLGLFADGGWNPSDPHPVAGWILAYVVSMVFWAACIRVVAKAIGGQEDARK
jgi:hypothetical protein